MMKKLLLIPILLFAAISFQGFNPNTKVSKSVTIAMGRISSQDSVLCWVFFKDKGTETEKYFNNPELVVTKKSLLRRGKFLSESNLINLTDLPIYSPYIDELNKLSLTVRGKSKWLNGVSVYVSKADVQKIEALPFVNNIDLVVHYSKRYTFNDKSYAIEDNRTPKYGNKDFYELDYGESYTQYQMINVPALHNLGYTGQGVTICVLDAGFNLLQHEVFAQMNILDRWDFVNNNYGVGDSSDMGSGDHGTKVLSSIGGYKPGKLIGPAYGASYLLAKTENTESETPVEEDNWIAAIEWADSLGADLATSSLGYLDYDDPTQSYTWEDMNGNTARITRAADLAVAKGIAVFVSAGNEGFDMSHNTLGAPADGDSVLSIGAVDEFSSRAYFSSVGPTADGRIKPDLMAMGQGVRTASSYSTTGYTNSSGTSFSCPIAAGVGALILSARQNITPMELANALKMTASNSSIPNREMGWGIINGLAALQFLPATEVEETTSIPSELKVFNNYPNPFNPSTKIDFQLASQSEVQIDLYNSAGERVKKIFSGSYPEGKHSFVFDGAGLNSGIYFLKVKTERQTKVLKLVLSK